MNKRILILAMVLALLLSACGADMREAMKGNIDESAEAATVERVSGYLEGGKYSGDDEYDPAAAVTVRGQIESGGFSGDDAYDPAAGLTLIALKGQEGTTTQGGSFSGDDEYDPAAGGIGQ